MLAHQAMSTKQATPESFRDCLERLEHIFVMMEFTAREDLPQGIEACDAVEILAESGRTTVLDMYHSLPVEGGGS